MASLYFIIFKITVIIWLLILGFILKLFFDRKKELNIIQIIGAELQVLKTEIKRMKKKDR